MRPQATVVLASSQGVSLAASRAPEALHRFDGLLARHLPSRLIHQRHSAAAAGLHKRNLHANAANAAAGCAAAAAAEADVAPAVIGEGRAAA